MRDPSRGHGSHALYQGPTLVGPQRVRKNWALAPAALPNQLLQSTSNGQYDSRTFTSENQLSPGNYQPSHRYTDSSRHPLFESEFESNLFALRQEKLRQIEALGQPTYPNQFLTSHTLSEVRQQFGDTTPEVLDANRTTVTVAGRIMAIRAQGKAGFAQLQQGGERLQIYVRLDAVGDQGFQLYKLLDLGDHIGVSGYVFRTRTGELTVHVEKITFLAKAMLALPEKYHGLADVELRYRQRYVDLFMNTDVRAVFVKRAQVLKAIRSFFDQRGYIEVETPMMQPIAGGAAARPFRTHHNALDLPLSCA